MSVADKFGFKQTFPFCEKDLSSYFSGGVYDFVDNLTRAQVMAFYWNLETFTISTAGSATNGFTTSGIGNVTLNPLTSSSFDEGDSEGAWFGQVLGGVAFGSFPAIHTPRERVCNAYDPTHGLIGYLSGDEAAHPLDRTFNVAFAISTDPGNAGKFRLYYHFFFDYTDGAGPSLTYGNPAFIFAPILASGTFTLGGITMNWEVTDAGTSSGHSGLNMTASSSDYTY